MHRNTSWTLKARGSLGAYRTFSFPQGFVYSSIFFPLRGTIPPTQGRILEASRFSSACTWLLSATYGHLFHFEPLGAVPCTVVVCPPSSRLGFLALELFCCWYAPVRSPTPSVNDSTAGTLFARFSACHASMKGSSLLLQYSARGCIPLLHRVPFSRAENLNNDALLSQTRLMDKARFPTFFRGGHLGTPFRKEGFSMRIVGLLWPWSTFFFLHWVSSHGWIWNHCFSWRLTLPLL